MSYSVSPPPGRARPTAVSVAVILLYVTAVLIAALTVLYAYATFALSPSVSTPGADPQLQDAMETTTAAVGIIALALYVAAAVGMVVLAIQVGKGRHPARVVTWALGGVLVLCCGCNAVSNALVGPMLSGLEGVDQQMIDDLNAAMPGWLVALQSTLYGLTALCLLAAIILLSLPAANDYFRKEQEVWTPPTWTGGDFPPPPAAASPFPPPAPLPPTAPVPPPAPVPPTAPLPPSYEPPAYEPPTPAQPAVHEPSAPAEPPATEPPAPPSFEPPPYQPPPPSDPAGPPSDPAR
jgi:hypothetical protein